MIRTKAEVDLSIEILGKMSELVDLEKELVATKIKGQIKSNKASEKNHTKQTIISDGVAEFLAKIDKTINRIDSILSVRDGRKTAR